MPTPSGVVWEGLELWRYPEGYLLLDWTRGGQRATLRVSPGDPDSARPWAALLKLRESDGEEACTSTVDVRGVTEADSLDRLSAVLRRSVLLGSQWLAGAVTTEGVLR